LRRFAASTASPRGSEAAVVGALVVVLGALVVVFGAARAALANQEFA
jgi:hypothetical protein